MKNDYLNWYLYKIIRNTEKECRNFVQRSFVTVLEALEEGHYLAKAFGDGWKVELYEVRVSEKSELKQIYKATIEY